MATIPIFSLLPNSVVLRLDATFTVDDTAGGHADMPADARSRKIAYPTQVVTVPSGGSSIDSAFATAWRAAHDGFLTGIILGL